MRSIFNDRRATVVLLGPALVVYVGVILIPVLSSLGYTFFTGSPVTGFNYFGLGNFSKLIDDPTARTALGFTLRYALIITVLQVGLGYALALFYVFFLRRASVFVRTLVFFPVVLPTVAVSLLFERLFASVPQDGVVNSAISAIGGAPVDWFIDGQHAFLVIIAMDLWRSMGFYAVLLYAGLLDIPEDLIESARLDGAGGFRLVWHIVLPMSLPVLLASLIFSINGTLKVFDSILALTGGGPGVSTTPLTLYMFNTAFAYGDYGYGSTIALVLTVICLATTLLLFRSLRRDPTRG